MKTIFAVLVFLIAAQSWANSDNEKQVIEITVTDNGFEPNAITVNSKQNVELKVTRKTDSTCATEILIPKENVKKALPLNQTVVLKLGQLKKGELKFGCGMNMMINGKIQVE